MTQTDPIPCASEPCPCAAGFWESPKVRPEPVDWTEKHLVPVDPPKELPDIAVYTHEKGELIICSSRSLAGVEALIDRRWQWTEKHPCPNHCIIGAGKLYHYSFGLRPKAHLTIKAGNIK